MLTAIRYLWFGGFNVGTNVYNRHDSFNGNIITTNNIHNTIIINNYGNNNVNAFSNMNMGAMNGGGFRSYAPEIVGATGAEFSENTQIEVAVETPAARLLQETNGTDPAPDTDKGAVRRRMQPIRYRNRGRRSARVKVVNEAAFNCSFQCTGGKHRRTCPEAAIDKCGLNIKNRTGNERVRGRMCIRYDPETAKE